MTNTKPPQGKHSLTTVQNTPENNKDCLKEESCWYCMIISCFLIMVIPIYTICIYGMKYTYDNQEECLKSSGNTEEDCNGEWYEWIIFILCSICFIATSCTIMKEFTKHCIDKYCCDKKSNSKSNSSYTHVVNV